MPDHSDPLVSVIVPHYQDLAGLDKCLAALTRQTMPRDRFEIIVSDNASPVGEDAVRDAIAGRATLMICRERGAGPTRNMGVAASRGRILAFVDSDCIAVPGWLEAGVAALDKADIVGGHVSVAVGDTARPTPVEAFELVFAFQMQSYVEKKKFLGSGNLFVPRAIFDDVGGFRAAVSEDVDWSTRAQEKGYSIAFSPTAEVAHPARITWDELMKKWRRVHSEMFTLARDQPGGRLKWAARTWAMPPSALAHTAKVLRTPVLPNARARLDALAILYRLRFWRFVDGNRKLLGLGR